VEARALALLNHLVTDALELVPDCLSYMEMLTHPDIFRFCAIPQVRAPARLAACVRACVCACACLRVCVHVVSCCAVCRRLQLQWRLPVCPPAGLPACLLDCPCACLLDCPCDLTGWLLTDRLTGAEAHTRLTVRLTNRPTAFPPPLCDHHTPPPCAQVMAIATLDKVYNNKDVFSGVVKVRKGLAVKMIMTCGTLPGIKSWFHQFATEIKRRTPPTDPSAARTLAICDKILKLTGDAAPSPLTAIFFFVIAFIVAVVAFFQLN
jgi:hypothetical protein